MMEQGLLEEVKNLYPNKHLNALNTVGYKELFDFMDDKITFEEAVNLIKQNSRRYAKRQLTWFNHQGDFESFEPSDLEKIKAYLDILIQYL
jgi:tRNA dimethylallyltransferase